MNDEILIETKDKEWVYSYKLNQGYFETFTSKVNLEDIVSLLISANIIRNYESEYKDLLKEIGADN